MHTIHKGLQRLLCLPFQGKQFHGYNREDFVFTRPPGVERYVVSPGNIWYGRLKLLFTMTVKIDGQQGPVDIQCAYVTFCYKMKLEPSGF